MARETADIGHNSDSKAARKNFNDIRFEIFGNGYGGYSLCRTKTFQDQGTIMLLHLNEDLKCIALDRKKVQMLPLKVDAFDKGFLI